MPLEDLRNEPMMAHLMDTLEAGGSIGHYGRLVFAMIARHFGKEDEVASWLAKDPECGEERARSLLRQVKARNYNPPKRERILEWMRRQEFPICPDTQDSGVCNPYRNLQFPEEIYRSIEQFQEENQDAA